MTDILEDVMPVNLIVNVKLRNKRMYEVAWAIAKLQGFENLEEFINNAVLEMIEIVVDGRGYPGITDVDWGFKTREQLRNEEKKQAKISQ
jgi:hypothetical protein